MNRPTPPPGAGMGVPDVPNLRDLGGWPTAGGGWVARGRVYRSDRLSSLAGPSLATVAGLGLRTVYDLRTHAESVADRQRRIDPRRVDIADEGQRYVQRIGSHAPAAELRMGLR